MRASHPARLSPASGGVARAPGQDLPDPFGPVGNTPLLPLPALAATTGVSFELWGKLESENPSGSVKDRAAAEIVRSALASGALGPGRTLVDASSGNTAVAYARLGAELGFAVRLYLPRHASPERLARLAELGAEVVLTDPLAGTDGAQDEARAFAARDPGRCFYADQYGNEANPRAHYRSTGPELWEQTEGRITDLVCGVGTGGTISGTGRFLKERRASVRVTAVEPTEPLHGLEGLKHLPTARLPRTFDRAVVDATERVATEDALALRVTLAQDRTVTVGPSAAAALVAALRVGRRHPGSVVVAILPDAGHAAGEGR